MATRRLVQLAGGVAVTSFTLAGGLVLAVQLRPVLSDSDPLARERAQQSVRETTAADRLQTFARRARGHDNAVRAHEFLTGISLSRSQLMRRAHGDVLELGVGTGRNFEYYSPSVVRHLTAVDAVPAMIDVAREKALRLASSRPSPPPLLPIALGLAADATATMSADLGTGLDLSKIEFVAGAAESLPFGDAQFDTVVDTFGLCSFEDPARALSEMQRVLKPGGRILLLEHGRSRTWPFMTRYLDESLADHLKEFGCYWNRDIRQLIDESGLVVDELSEFHCGTGCVVVARKR